MSDSLQPHGLYSSWNSPGQNTGVGSHSLLWGIFPTQGSNPGLPHRRWIFYQLSHHRRCSVAKSRPTLCEHVPCSAAGFLPCPSELAEGQSSLSQSLLTLMSIVSMMPSNHPILGCLFSSCPQSFPASRPFQRVGSSHQVAKALKLQLQHQSFQ